jgi:hypothetical protein
VPAFDDKFTYADDEIPIDTLDEPTLTSTAERRANRLLLRSAQCLRHGVTTSQLAC